MNSTPKNQVFDVAIVGGGISGLTAAYRLKQAGQNVVLLEAEDRVGGRLFNQTITGGGIVDAGGSWVGPQQTSILALLHELSVATWPQYTDGRHILLWNGKQKTYTGEMPPFSPIAQLWIGLGIIRLNLMAKKIHGAHRDAFDKLTLGEWLRKHTRTEGCSFFFDIVTATSFGCKPEELSLLEFLAHVESAGNLQTLVGVKNAALDSHISGGSGGFCQLLGEHTGWQNIRLNSPVTKMTQDSNGVQIHATSEVIRAKKVIMAMDPALAHAMLSRGGTAATEPIGNIHFAGAESSPVWEGHMDGAVYAGERAAREILSQAHK